MLKLVWTCDMTKKAMDVYQLVETSPGIFYLRPPIVNQFGEGISSTIFSLEVVPWTEQDDANGEEYKFELGCPYPNCRFVTKLLRPLANHIREHHYHWYRSNQAKEVMVALILCARRFQMSHQILGGRPTEPCRPLSMVVDGQIGIVGGTFRLRNANKGIEKGLFLEACKFFSTKLEIDNLRQFESASESLDRINLRLPVELQLNILGHLDIHEADVLVRNSYPHLITHWCRSISGRYESWFNDLTARENLRYVDVIDTDSVRLEIFRLRSIDLHPNIVFDHTHLPLRPGLSKISNPPSLHNVRYSIYRTLRDLLSSLQDHLASDLGDRFKWMHRDPTYNILDHLMNISSVLLQRISTSAPYRESPVRPRLLEVCRADVPFLIPLTPASEDPPLRPRVQTGAAYLLIYPDELAPILRSLEVFLRQQENESYTGAAKLNMFSCMELGIVVQFFVRRSAAGPPSANSTKFNTFLGKAVNLWLERRRSAQIAPGT